MTTKKRRSPSARALASKLYSQRVVPDKKKDIKKSGKWHPLDQEELEAQRKEIENEPIQWASSEDYEE